MRKQLCVTLVVLAIMAVIALRSSPMPAVTVTFSVVHENHAPPSENIAATRNGDPSTVETKAPPAAPVTTASFLEMLMTPLNPSATCQPTAPRASPRPPTEGGPLDAEILEGMKNLRPPFGYNRPVRLALCLNGRSEMTEGGAASPEEARKIMVYRWANLMANVIEPAKALQPQGDVTFDVFVFTTSPGFVAAIKDVVKPVRIESGDSLSYYHSPLHSLTLMWDHSQSHNLSYDRVLLLRNDVVFFFPIPWTLLNPQLFYVTNWCRAIGTPVAHSPNGTLCFPLSIFFHDSVHEGIPDYMFLGQSSDMSLVFSTIIDDVLTCTTRPTSSCCAHAVYGGQIMRLYHARRLRVGRFMHHHFDFDIHRSLDFWRIVLHQRNQTWLPSAANGSYTEDLQEWVPRLWSWCTRERAYCRSEGAPLTSGFEHW